MISYHLEDQYPRGQAGALLGPYGSRVPPTLIILHSTRSGIPYHPDTQELQSTLNHFHNGVAGAHVVVSGAGDLYWIVPLDWQAWGASYLNPRALHIELTQPTKSTPYQEGHYEGCAAAIREMVAAYPSIPILHTVSEDETGIIGHDETAQGQEATKSDPGYRWDWGKLMGLLGGDTMDKIKLEAALNRLWKIRQAFEAGAADVPEFATLSTMLFDTIVDIKVATGLQ